MRKTDHPKMHLLPSVALFIGSFLLFTFSSYGQINQGLRQEIDSLKKIYLHHQNDTLRLKVLTKLGQRMRFVDIDSSKYYLKKAIALYKAKKVNLGSLAFAYNVIGNIYKIEPNLDSARHYYEEAYQVLSKEKVVGPFLAIIAPYGSFLVENGEVERGIKMLQEGITIAKEQEEYASLSFLYEYMGEVFQETLKDNNRAIDFYNKGLEVSKEMETTDVYNFHRLTTSLSLNLSSIYLEKQAITQAIDYAEKAVNAGHKADMLQLVVAAYNNLCQGHIILGQYQKAKRYNEEGLKLNEKIQNTYAGIENRILRQAILLKTNAYAKCVDLGRNILRQYQAQLKNSKKAKIFEQLCECHAHLGNTTAVIKSKDSLIYYQNKSSNIAQNELLARLDREYEIKEKEAENELLKTKKEATEQQLNTQRLAALGLGAALLFAVAWAIAFYRANLRKKRYNTILESQVKQRTQALQIANDDLEQANYELRTFSYIASHDIKEPIRNIGNFAGLIKSQLPSKLIEEFGFHFETITKSTKQLYTLIEDFTKYINLSKNSEMPREAIDLNELVEGINATLTVIGKYQNGQIINSGLPTISSNKSAAYVIFKNLLENGLKFNKSTYPKIELSYLETPTYHIIQIQDNGIGIPFPNQNQIFEMFKRLHGKNEYEGTGIGLALVNLLIKKLKGKIEVESEVSQGSLFKLFLPKK